MSDKLLCRARASAKASNFDDTVNSRFKKDLKLQIHLHKALFLSNQFLDSLHKSFLNETTHNSRFKKGKMDFLKSIVYCIANKCKLRKK